MVNALAAQMVDAAQLWLHFAKVFRCTGCCIVQLTDIKKRGACWLQRPRLHGTMDTVRRKDASASRACQSAVPQACRSPTGWLPNAHLRHCRSQQALCACHIESGVTSSSTHKLINSCFCIALSAWNLHILACILDDLIKHNLAPLLRHRDGDSQVLPLCLLRAHLYASKHSIDQSFLHGHQMAAGTDVRTTRCMLRRQHDIVVVPNAVWQGTTVWCICCASAQAQYNQRSCARETL